MALVLLSGVLLAGCGGGAETAADAGAAAGAATADTAAATDPAAAPTGTTDPAAATAPPAAPGSATTTPGAAPVPGADPTAMPASSNGESFQAAPGAQVPTSSLTPQPFLDALGKRTVVVFHYQPGGIADELQRAALHKAVSQFKDVLLLEYKPSEHEKFGDLIEKLGLFRAPSLAVVNREGAIQNFWSSYVPTTLLVDVIGVANGGAKSSVINEDAPASGAKSNPVSALTTAANTAAAG